MGLPGEVSRFRDCSLGVKARGVFIFGEKSALESLLTRVAFTGSEQSHRINSRWLALHRYSGPGSAQHANPDEEQGPDRNDDHQQLGDHETLHIRSHVSSG